VNEEKHLGKKEGGVREKESVPLAYPHDRPPRDCVLYTALFTRILAENININSNIQNKDINKLITTYSK